MYYKQTLVLLIFAISLVIGEPHSKNIQKELFRKKRGSITEFFGNATQIVADAIQIAATQQEVEPIRSRGDSFTKTVKDAAIAVKNYTQAGIDYWKIQAKSLNSNLAKNETTNLTNDVYQDDFQKSAKESVKASFDVALAFPKFGLYLTGDEGANVSQALQKSFALYEPALIKTANKYKRLAKKFTNAGLNMFQKFANATVVPKLTEVLKSVTNDSLSKRLELLNNRTINTRNNALEVAHDLTRGGMFFDKAASDLEVLLNKYSMNVVIGDDERSYASVLKGQIKATSDSLKASEECLRAAFGGVVQLFKNANTLKEELLMALEYVGKNITDQDLTALEMAKNITKAAFRNIKNELCELGGMIGRTGEELVQNSVTLGLIIPKFGLGILKLQIGDLEQEFVKLIDKIEKAVLAIVGKFTAVGQKISFDGDFVEESVLQSQESDDSITYFEKTQAELDAMLEKMNDSLEFEL